MNCEGSRTRGTGSSNPSPSSGESQERTTERPKSGGDAGRAAWAQPDPPERAMRRCWLTFAAAALVTGAYAPVTSADLRYCTELRPENGQRGAQCGGDRASHLV